MTKKTRIIGRTDIGWFVSCADKEWSEWGHVEGFCHRLRSGSKIESGWLYYPADVEWERIHPAGQLPDTGDGIAFYHSTRAFYPKGDRFKRQPRVSAVGELASVVVEGGHVREIVVKLNPHLLDLMEEQPIVREGQRERQLFEDCGILSGVAYSCYRADKAAWRRLMALLPA